MNTSVPFLVESDIALLVHVVPGQEKRPRCFAEISAFATQQTGATELSLLDHDLEQQIED